MTAKSPQKLKDLALPFAVGCLVGDAVVALVVVVICVQFIGFLAGFINGMSGHGVADMRFMRFVPTVKLGERCFTWLEAQETEEDADG